MDDDDDELNAQIDNEPKKLKLNLTDLCVVIMREKKFNQMNKRNKRIEKKKNHSKSKNI